MKAQHTPGNWKVGFSTPFDLSTEPALSVLPENAIDGQPVRPICKVSPDSSTDDEDRANAQLLAASPAMYKALAGIADYAQEMIVDCCADIQSGGKAAKSLDMWQQVINALLLANPAHFEPEAEESEEFENLLASQVY